MPGSEWTLNQYEPPSFPQPGLGTQGKSHRPLQPTLQKALDCREILFKYKHIHLRGMHYRVIQLQMPLVRSALTNQRHFGTPHFPYWTSSSHMDSLLFPHTCACFESYTVTHFWEFSPVLHSWFDYKSPEDVDGIESRSTFPQLSKTWDITCRWGARPWAFSASTKKVTSSRVYLFG